MKVVRAVFALLLLGLAGWAAVWGVGVVWDVVRVVDRQVVVAWLFAAGVVLLAARIVAGGVHRGLRERGLEEQRRERGAVYRRGLAFAMGDDAGGSPLRNGARREKIAAVELQAEMLLCGSPAVVAAWERWQSARGCDDGELAARALSELVQVMRTDLGQDRLKGDDDESGRAGTPSRHGNDRSVELQQAVS